MVLNQDQLKVSSVLDSGDKTARQHWMGILARASGNEVAALLACIEPQPSYELIKRPETGTLMLEGRAGGAGQRFNMGEATMTRCVIRLSDGTMGFSYALGRAGKGPSSRLFLTRFCKAMRLRPIRCMPASTVWRNRNPNSAIGLRAKRLLRKSIFSRLCGETVNHDGALTLRFSHGAC